MNKGCKRNKSKVIFTLTLIAASIQVQAEETKQLGQVTVTGRRAESDSAETPQKIEVIDKETIERTVSHDLTDLLKKNAGVDVIQYSGALSGIGIRGFTPEFSGINKRSLLLIDGRPAGATNLATITGNNVERVEVLKGSASALYGASAMGGVVNIITRSSTDKIGGNIFTNYGSFDSKELGGQIGGKINSTFDFDYSGSGFRQDNDYKMGNGQTLSNSSYERYNHALRLGANLNKDWRLVAHADSYAGRNIGTPGDVAYNTIDRTGKDIDRYGGDLRLTGKLPNQVLSVTAYSSHEESENKKKESSTLSEQTFLPFKTFSSEIDWTGLQIQDEWAWSKNASLTFGVDSEEVKLKSRNFNPDSSEKSPFSANSARNTLGVYAQNLWLLNQQKTALTLGVRHDRIEVETFDTPLKTGFTPSSTTFTSTNPSFGIKHEVIKGLRGHATIGRAFVSPDSGQLTGADTRINTSNGIIEITQGNPNVRPETSVTWDMGTEWQIGAFNGDITYFSTKVRDKISSVKTSTPTTVITTYQNADSAYMHGLEVDFGWQMAKDWRVTAALTRLFSRKSKIAGVESDLNVVAELTARLSLDVDKGPWTGRASARYVGERKDYDFVFNTGQIRYPTFVVVDLSTRYKFNTHHSVKLQVENAFNKYYYEKLGFPLQGRSIYAGYQYDF